MFKRILVLFILLITSTSCRQSTAPILSYPPIEDNGITNGDNTGGGNTDGDTGDLLYGYYDVYLLRSDEPVKFSISDTYTMKDEYFNMILNPDGTPKFTLSKVDGATGTVSKTYTFNSNLDIIIQSTEGSGGTEGSGSTEGNEGTTEIIAKKFRGVCIVRIYPDASIATMSSLSIGDYTIAGVYTEMEENPTKSGYRAMEKVDKFQNYGYDELIILRPDKTITASKASGTSSDDTADYRADILFNDDEGISFYYYDPDRTFKYQNTNYIFERIVEETPTE